MSSGSLERDLGREELKEFERRLSFLSQRRLASRSVSRPESLRFGSRSSLTLPWEQTTPRQLHGAEGFEPFQPARAPRGSARFDLKSCRA